jgi:hypothetical protein
MIRQLTTDEVVRASSATPRQVDHWNRIGLLGTVVAADGPGTQRKWALEEAVVARLLAAWSAIGHSHSLPDQRQVQRIRWAVHSRSRVVVIRVSPLVRIELDVAAAWAATEAACPPGIVVA